jgi:hypothetical protein
MIKKVAIIHIKSSIKQQHHHLLKLHTFLSYLFELGCDVAIQLNMNVSSIESFVVVFG